MSEFEQTPKPQQTYEEDIAQAIDIAHSAGPAPEPESASLLPDEEWAALSQAARRTVEDTLAQPYTPAEQQVDRPSTRRGALTGIGLTLAAGAALAGIHEANSAPEFSEETTTYTVQEGDGIQAAAQHVKGDRDIRDAAAYIEADPANIDVLKDGLQPGEQLVIPVSTADYTPPTEEQ